MTRFVGIFLYEEIEVLDFAGPFEVFSTAVRVQNRLDAAAEKPFVVVTIAEHLEPVRARGGLIVLPQATLATHPPLDILIIPGGVHAPVLEREEVSAWINRCATRAEITASVCTGALLLAHAGLLRGKPATTHWEDLPELRAYADIEVVENKRWVDTGKIITSAGISAGIDMSLHIVARVEGEELAMRTARQMDYLWHATANSR
jgi:transcriptional regulator GlxA family with amidase domain